jgi:hypothetical protein
MITPESGAGFCNLIAAACCKAAAFAILKGVGLMLWE